MPNDEIRKKLEIRNSNSTLSNFDTRIVSSFVPAQRDSFVVRRGSPSSRSWSSSQSFHPRALLLPAVNRAQRGWPRGACTSNLRQIGVALQLYIQENNNRLPRMYDQWPGVTNEAPGPHVVLASQLGNTNVLWCPSDKWLATNAPPYAQSAADYFHQTGSSYSWTACSMRRTPNI